MNKIPASELRLGDVVQCYEGAFGCAVVRQIKDGHVTLFRPYVAVSDFSYTGGVIPYIGIEEFTVPQDSTLFVVWQRGVGNEGCAEMKTSKMSSHKIIVEVEVEAEAIEAAKDGLFEQMKELLEGDADPRIIGFKVLDDDIKGERGVVS